MILFTFGVNESGQARIMPDPAGQPRIHVDGNCNVLGKVDLQGEPFQALLLFGPQDRQPPADLSPRPALVFNQISDADSHRTALERCLELCEQLPGVPVINHPRAVQATGRDAVSRRLQDLPGVHMPRTVRITPRSPAEVFAAAEAESIEPPFIVRTTGDHNGRRMVRVEARGEEGPLHALALDGSEHYLMEFVEYADSEGLYAKHRVIMVDGEAVTRSVMVSEDWLVNSSCYPFMRSQGERLDPPRLVREFDRDHLPALADRLEEIARRLELDYFGVDFHLRPDGEMVVFEANANMNPLMRTYAPLNDRADRIAAQLVELIRRRRGTGNSAAG